MLGCVLLFPHAVSGGNAAPKAAYGDASAPAPQDSIRQAPRRIPSVGKSRRARAGEVRDRILRSLQSTVDTTQRQGISLASLPRDSSARLAQHQQVRIDPPYVSDRNQRQHPLYVNEPATVQYKDQLDSTSFTYRRRRIIGGVDSRIPYDIPLEEYSKLRLQRTLRDNWETMTKLYISTGERKAGLSELFGKVTNIEIPVPKNPIFSIFGPNIIRLQINGAVDIHAAFRNTQSDLFTASPLGQSRNEPDFNQQVQVSVKGEIGDKLKIDADWNTQRTFEYENQLKVRYQGYEDEIVQSVEAGNVSLGTSSSFISPSAALFGIKAAFQFGPLKLTTVASQKKGQIKELSVSGGASATEFKRRLEEYSTDHYFIDTIYFSKYEDYYLAAQPTIDPNVSIRDMEVWVTNLGTPDPQKDREVVAFMNVGDVLGLQDDTLARRLNYNLVPDSIEIGRFIKLEPNVDYVVNLGTGILTLNRSLQFEQAIAVAYVISADDGSGKAKRIGNFGAQTTSSESKLIMKLVRPGRLGPQFKKGWKLMLKNRYPVGGRGLKKEGFDVNVEYEAAGLQYRTVMNNVGTLEMFGLDRFQGESVSGQDQKLDYRPGFTIDESRGELIFPTLEPFKGENILKMLSARLTIQQAQQAADSFGFNRMYDTSKNGITNDFKNKFTIVGTASAASRSTYTLGSFNIVEGSVQVIVDGQPATPNVDYTVDYIVGQVVIKNQALLVPGKNLQIKYEANDLFQLASKTLVAARGDFDVGKNSSLGFTIMNLNQKSLSDKVRLGEEPISNTIMGVDGGTTFELNFLTKALNYLPGIQTTQNSQITFRGEFAYMSPDPNTRKSSITQDGGSGLAYIDDFEGARRTIPLGTPYTTWHESSVPVYIAGLDVVRPDQNRHVSASNPLLVPELQKMNYKSRLTWFNVIPSDVFISDIWPERDYAQGQDQVSVLNFYFKPNVRGAYNFDTLRTVFRFPGNGWGGVQHLLGTSSNNLLDENIGFIELWINVVHGDPTTKMLINLGYVSEDAIPNRKLDTEDGLDNPSRTPNGILNRLVEDVGMDGLSDDAERLLYKSFLDAYPDHPEYNNDPAGDNWKQPPIGSYELVDGTNHVIKVVADAYEGANGQEGSSGSELGARVPDTEDLNGNNTLDGTNAYFEYELPMNNDSLNARGLIVGGGTNGWYQIRIPLEEYSRVIGDPTFSNIEAVRFWITGSTDSTEPTFVRLTEMNLVGNQWEKLDKTDKNFSIAVVNIEENLYYTSPVEGLRTKDPTRPDQNIRSNEGSLNLIIDSLEDGQRKEAFKRFSARPLDMFSYRTMRMFIHGETGEQINKGYKQFKYVSPANYDAEVVFRFGTDSLNYYEYRAPIHPGWDPENDITIRFADLTAIKLARDSVTAPSRFYSVPDGPPGATYSVRGQPSLMQIRYMSIGVENPADKGAPGERLSGEVWVDELRLTEVDDTPGWAYRFDTSIKLADVATLQFSYSDRDPFFHALEERFGSRNTTRNWNLSAGLALDRFLPESWNGTQLSFAYSHVEAIARPQYIAGSDVLVDKAVERISADKGTTAGDSVRQRTEMLSVTETYALPSIRLNIPVNFWLITETINRMTFSYSYSSSYARTPVTEYSRAWGWNFRFGYTLPFSPSSYVEPFTWTENIFFLSAWKGLRIFYLPKQVSTGFALNRAQTRDRSRGQLAENPVQRTLSASRNFSFGWQFIEGGFLNLGTDYSVDVSSDLRHLEVDRVNNQRSFSEILGDLVLSDRLIGFGIDLSYGQTISISSRPVVPPILKLDKILSPRLGFSTRYDWQNNIQAGDLGRSVGWSNTTSAATDINLRPITDELFGTVVSQAAEPADTNKRNRSLANLLNFGKLILKSTIFGFERVNFQFTQQNRSQNGGVLGRPGFGNLFARVPFLQSSTVENGPSLLYQMGLSTDPHGDVIIKLRDRFPFVEGYSTMGPRARGAILNDVFSQSNRIQMSTSRPLWEGASINLNWSVGWNYSQTRTLATDSVTGIPRERNRSVSGDVDRTFFTLPPVFIFKFLKTGMEAVNTKFEAMKKDAHDARTIDAKLSDAFVGGLEGLPLISRIFGQLAPRANWSLHWDGLEKMPLLSSIANRVSLDHAYTSNYRRRWRFTPEGSEVTESQSISYGFAPLIGVNIGFKELLKGTFGATVRYGTSTGFDLTPSAQNILESNQSDISVTANFTKTGFEIPLFGLSLSNDIDLSFSYTTSHNSRKQFDFRTGFKPDGQPLEGSTRSTMEPRLRYTLSARVSASAYYRYTKIAPDEGGSKIPGSTTNEGGLDIHVAIQ